MNRDLRAHALEHFGEAHVALDAIAADALDAHRPAADRTRGEEVRGRRGVALDQDLSRTRIGLFFDTERTPTVALHFDAEAAHYVERDLDIGLGNQLALHL